MFQSLFKHPPRVFNRPTTRITIAGLMVALGVIVPYVTGHAAGVPGNVLLPMHLPVLLSGLFTGPLGGLLTGILTPIISSILTNMPPVYPMLPIMLVQLAVMGFLMGLLTDNLRLGIIPALIISSVGGWAVYGLVFQVLLLMNPNLRALSMLAALSTGIPGLIAQLILVPVIYLAILRSKTQVRPAASETESAASIPKIAKTKIAQGDASCILVREGTIVHEADGRGVKPLLELLDQTPERLIGAMVYDRIIGKGAAMLLVLGGVKYVYGERMSEAGRAYLVKHGIDADYGELLPFIPNRTRTGMCPIEDAVKDIDEPVAGLTAIRARIAELMSGTYQV